MEFPVEHLSASSINKFLRCPRQWQDQYVFKHQQPSNSALVIGSAVHLALSRSLKGEPVGNFFEQTVEETMADAGDIVWKQSADVSKQLALKHLYDYERYAKYLDVVDTEKEILLDVPGIDIPIVGFIDVVCSNHLIDLKTTGYFKRNVELNPEWKLQANIYQLYEQLPFEFHVLTRSKTDPVCLPDNPDHQLFVDVPNKLSVETYLAQIFSVMKHYCEEFEESPWPGNVTHPWAAKYCVLEECCQR